MNVLRSIRVSVFIPIKSQTEFFGGPTSLMKDMYRARAFTSRCRENALLSTATFLPKTTEKSLVLARVAFDNFTCQGGMESSQVEAGNTGLAFLSMSFFPFRTCLSRTKATKKSNATSCALCFQNKAPCSLV